jgi:FkbM family methyltransferase
MIISYAANWEDVLLYRVFKERAAGIYVDIGASDPTHSSVTKLFYDRGWHGVNLEPSPIFGQLQAERPRDINLPFAVSDHDGEVEFYVHDGLVGTSTLSREVEPGLSDRDLKRRLVRVKCITLATLEAQFPLIRNANFLKIDAEGAEDAIVAGANWDTFRPELLLIEATKAFSNERCDEIRVRKLTSVGYDEVYFDGINAWFVRSESADLRRHFKLPVNQLDDFVRFDPEKERMSRRLQARGRLKKAFRRLFNLGRDAQATTTPRQHRPQSR